MTTDPSSTPPAKPRPAWRLPAVVGLVVLLLTAAGLTIWALGGSDGAGTDGWAPWNTGADTAIAACEAVASVAPGGEQPPDPVKMREIAQLATRSGDAPVRDAGQ